MAELRLRRFSTIVKYEEFRYEILDGDFFIIDETEQLGVNYKGRIFLTPSDILHGYALPEGEIVITERDTIKEAIGKLEKHINDTDSDIAVAISKADSAYSAVEEFKNFDVSDSDAALLALAGRIRALEDRDVVISAKDYAALEAIDVNKIYYIYE